MPPIPSDFSLRAPPRTNGLAVLPQPDPSQASAARGRFQRDVLWNFGGLVVLALSGFALTSLIGSHYGLADLGLFNQVVAPYIFFSQAAVGGIDRSVLRAIAEAPDDRERVARVLLGGLVPAALLSAFFTAVFVGARHGVAAWLESPGVAVGMAWAAPGLFFFALNKVLLAATNGLRRMRAFAVLNALRYVLIVGGLLVALALGFGGERLGFVFTFAEVLLFACLAFEVGGVLGGLRRGGVATWARTHLVYGAKSAVSGMLLELNARVDVLMIGRFLDDSRVGIYSLASTLAEGVFQLFVVLQNNYNPLIARSLAEGADQPGPAREALHAMIRRGKRLTYAGMSLAAALATVGYPLYLFLMRAPPDSIQGHVSFGVLMAGMWIVSGYMPFAQTLLMANRPGWHTAVMVGSVGSNVIFNWLLIPRLDITGAAVGTGLALVVSALLLVGFVRARVGVRL